MTTVSLEGGRRSKGDAEVQAQSFRNPRRGGGEKDGGDGETMVNLYPSRKKAIKAARGR